MCSGIWYTSFLYLLCYCLETFITYQDKFVLINMEDITQPRLDAKDKEYIDLLIASGLHINESKLIICLMNRNDLTQSQLGFMANISQPMVSDGLQGLISRNWVTFVKHPSEKGRGRDVLIYTLLKTSDIIDQIEANFNAEQLRFEQDLEQLQELIA